jgi:hypothetical protein
MWSVKVPCAKARPFAAFMQRYGLLYLISYSFAAQTYAHTAFTLSSPANAKNDANSFDASSSEGPSHQGSSFDAPSFKCATKHSVHSLESVQTNLARRVHQWRGIWEDPEMTEARNSIDTDLRHEFEYLLYQDPLTQYALRFNVATRGNGTARNETSTGAKTQNGAATTSLAVQSSVYNISVCAFTDD